MNAVEREPVETRVLNPTASEASYKPKQRSYRKTNLKKNFWHPIVPAPKCPVPKCPAPKWRRRIGGAETYPTQKMGIFYSLISFKSVLSKVVATENKNCLYQTILHILAQFLSVKSYMEL